MGIFSVFDNKHNKYEKQYIEEYEQLLVVSYSFGLSGIAENGLGSHKRGMELLNDTYKSLLERQSEITQKGFEAGVTINAEVILRKSYDNAIKNIVAPVTTKDSRWDLSMKRGKAVDRLARSFTTLLKILEVYKNTHEHEHLVIMGWFFIFGVQSSVLKWYWDVNRVGFRLHGYEKLGKMTIREAMELVAKRFDDVCPKDIPDGAFIKIYRDKPDLYLECANKIPLNDLYDLLP